MLKSTPQPARKSVGASVFADAIPVHLFGHLEHVTVVSRSFGSLGGCFLGLAITTLPGEKETDGKHTCGEIRLGFSRGLFFEPSQNILERPTVIAHHALFCQRCAVAPDLLTDHATSCDGMSRQGSLSCVYSLSVLLNVSNARQVRFQDHPNLR